MLMAAGVLASTGVGLIVSVALVAITMIALLVVALLPGPIEPEAAAPGDDIGTIQNAVRWGLLRQKMVVGFPKGGNTFACQQKVPLELFKAKHGSKGMDGLVSYK